MCIYIYAQLFAISKFYVRFRWCYREGIMKEVAFQLVLKDRDCFLKTALGDQAEEAVFIQHVARHTQCQAHTRHQVQEESKGVGFGPCPSSN